MTLFRISMSTVIGSLFRPPLGVDRNCTSDSTKSPWKHSSNDMNYLFPLPCSIWRLFLLHYFSISDIGSTRKVLRYFSDSLDAEVWQLEGTIKLKHTHLRVETVILIEWMMNLTSVVNNCQCKHLHKYRGGTLSSHDYLSHVCMQIACHNPKSYR